jgi:hypothetical protein
LALVGTAGDRGDREADAEEVDDEANDGEFQVKAGHADAGEREDNVLHKEVDGGPPGCCGNQQVDSIEEGAEASDGEIYGGGTESDDEVADEPESGCFGAAGVCGLTAEDSSSDALEQPRRSERKQRAVDDQGGCDVAAAGEEACEEDGFGRGIGVSHIEEVRRSIARGVSGHL